MWRDGEATARGTLHPPACHALAVTKCEPKTLLHIIRANTLLGKRRWVRYVKSMNCDILKASRRSVYRLEAYATLGIKPKPEAASHKKGLHTLWIADPERWEKQNTS